MKIFSGIAVSSPDQRAEKLPDNYAVNKRSEQIYLQFLSNAAQRCAA
jgi:hypothetical protein